MLAASCSLLLQLDAKYTPLVRKLPPGHVTVTFDGSPNKRVFFQGCTILQLNPVGGSTKAMPPILTIAGPCTFSKEDKKDFEIMMRTHAQSRQMGFPPNGSMDWPDCRAFCTCPCCGTVASPQDAEEEYMMLFYPLFQEGLGGYSIRIICLLTCLDCFENLVEDMTVSATREGMDDSTFSVPLLDAVDDQGPITWLERGVGMGRRDDETFPAYRLYQVWEYTGAFQKLQDVFGESLQEAMSKEGLDVELQAREDMPSQTTSADAGEEHWVMKSSSSSSKTGRMCRASGCGKVHRSRPEGGGKKIRLAFCSGCEDTLYCSTECQSNDWEAHRLYCKAKQREIEEAKKKKKAAEEAEEKAKMDAVAASFAPLSLLNPQGGGAGRKHNKKKGGKKKKKGKK